MINSRVIFEGVLSPNTYVESQRFTNAQFVFFDISYPFLEENEGIQIGFSLLIEIPVIGKTVTKYVPHKITEAFFEGGMDSKELIGIPREFADSNYNFFCGFNSSRNVLIRVYAITSDTSIDSLDESLDNISTKLDIFLLGQGGLIYNQMAQNTALQILGTSLFLVTGGISAGVNIPLAPSTLTLMGLTRLLPILLP